MKDKHWDYLAIASLAFSLGVQIGITVHPSAPVRVRDRIITAITSLIIAFSIAWTVRLKLTFARSIQNDGREDLARLRRFNDALREIAGPSAVARARAVTERYEQRVN